MDSTCDGFDVWSFYGLLDVWIFVFFTTGIEFSRGFKLVVYRILKFSFFFLCRLSYIRILKRKGDQGKKYRCS